MNPGILFMLKMDKELEDRRETHRPDTDASASAQEELLPKTKNLIQWLLDWVRPRQSCEGC